MGNAARKLDPVRKELLKIGRQLRGLTQSEVSIATGINQSLISKYEGGRPVPESDLEQIAEALELPESFFRQSDDFRAPDGTTMMMFRRRQTASMKTVDQIMAETWRQRVNIAKLLSSVELQVMCPIPFHEPNSQSREDVEEIAERVRLQLRVPPGPVASVMKVFESLGIAVIRRELPAKVDALVDSSNSRAVVVLLSQSLPGGRQRFTLSHELGHLVLHNQFSLPYKEMEDQADQFAAAFLMPANEISRSLRDISMESLISLSIEWKVSIQALVRRAFDLELLTQRQLNWWNEQIGKSGYRTLEPVALPIEEPTLVDSLIRLHMEELDYSEAELAEMLNMQEWEFRNVYRGAKPIRVVTRKKPVLRTFSAS